MKRKGALFPVVVLLLALAVSATAVFGWFSAGKSYIGNIEFATGKVDAKVSLYALRDFNLDGVPDYNPDAEDRLYKTDLLNPPVGIPAGIKIENAIPGEIFSYRLIVENVSNNAILFALSVSSARTGSGGIYLNDAFFFRAARAEGSAGAEYSIPLAGSSVVLIDAPETGAGMAPIEIPKGGTILFDFRLAFGRLSELQAALPAVFSGKADLNDYLGKSFDGVKFRFEFRQSANSNVSA